MATQDNEKVEPPPLATVGFLSRIETSHTINHTYGTQEAKQGFLWHPDRSLVVAPYPPFRVFLRHPHRSVISASAGYQTHTQKPSLIFGKMGHLFGPSFSNCSTDLHCFLDMNPNLNFPAPTKIPPCVNVAGELRSYITNVGRRAEESQTHKRRKSPMCDLMVRIGRSDVCGFDCWAVEIALAQSRRTESWITSGGREGANPVYP